MIKSLKFSHKILLAAALVVIATFSLFTLYNDSLQRASIREDLEDYLHEMGEITASNVQNWLSGRILLIENLAQTLARDHSPETTQALLEQPLLGSTFLFTYLGQTDGTYTARPTSDLPADYDPRRRPWYNAATSAGQTTLTEPYMEPAIHELVLTIASPARQGGQPFGVVGGDLSLQTVVKIINSLDFGGMGYAFLVSGDGKILVHPDKDQVMKSLSDVYPRNTPKIGSGFSEAELHGNTRILSFSPVKGLSGLDWYIGISVDKDKAYAMLTKLRTSAIVAALIAVVAIVLLLGMLIRVLMQPLTDMGRAMQDIAQGEGDLTKRLKVTSNDEFGALAISFNRFVERIHESIREVAGTARQLHDVAQLVVNALGNENARPRAWRFGIWGGRWESNPRHQEPQSCALPTELRPPYRESCRTFRLQPQRPDKPSLKVVRTERLELSRLAALEPKSSVSTNSTTSAGHCLEMKTPGPGPGASEYGVDDGNRTHDTRSHNPVP